MAKGVFRGEVLELELGDRYVDFKLGQEQYERPVLCSMLRADFPTGAVNNGDRVVIEGRSQPGLSKAGTAYERVRCQSVTLDFDGAFTSSADLAVSKK